jgi:signal transduction histidine kinase/DNA-binding response OmpR family regulator
MQKTILVVDDNPTILKYMVKLLDKAGHRVFTAEDGLAALSRLASLTPDIIFTDLVMPNIDGDKLCLIAKKMSHLKSCYFVLLSAAASELDFDYKKIGFDACIAKGKPSQMAGHILEAINRSEHPEKKATREPIMGLEDVYPRRMTKELLVQNKRLESILESMSDGILEIYFDKVMYANSAASSLLNLPIEKLMATYPPDLFDETERLKIIKLLEPVGGNEPFQNRNVSLVLDGIHLSIKKLPENDESSATLLMLTDITKYKRVEESLTRSQSKLEKEVDKRTVELLKAYDRLKNETLERQQIEKERRKLEVHLQRAEKMEAIGTLAGGVAHDLNNILSGVTGYPELLLIDLPQDSPLRRPLETIKKSGEKAAAVVQDLLTLARRNVTAADVVNLNDIVADYLKSPEYDKLLSFHRQIEVLINLDSSLPNIIGSPVHLSKTIMNLFSNAAEAMPDGGKILISTSSRSIVLPIKGYDTVTEGEYVVISVADNGMGIDETDMARIFEPFYTKKKMGRSGTGLGLAVVWATANDHNGYIEADSKVGIGTTFTLYFPTTKQKSAADDPALPQKDYMGNGESVLVIDDVEEQREIAGQMLKKLGYKVSVVKSGEEAIEYLKNNSVDLIVLDMIMAPGMDGLETYQKIIKMSPGQKAVIASGFSETKHVKATQSLGAGQFVQKPYALEKIGIAVKETLKK